jgi:hypothetical protein
MKFKILISLNILAAIIAAQLHQEWMLKAYQHGRNSGIGNEQAIIADCQEHKNYGQPDENYCVESIYGTNTDPNTRDTPSYFELIGKIRREEKLYGGPL